MRSSMRERIGVTGSNRSHISQKRRITDTDPLKFRTARADTVLMTDSRRESLRETLDRTARMVIESRRVIGRSLCLLGLEADHEGLRIYLATGEGFEGLYREVEGLQGRDLTALRSSVYSL